MTITIVGILGNMSYAPTPASVKVGQTVAWHNSDVIAHTSTQDAGAWDTGAIGPGATSSPIKMTAAGAFNYHCAIHGFQMVSTLNVQ